MRSFCCMRGSGRRRPAASAASSSTGVAERGVVDEGVAAGGPGAARRQGAALALRAERMKEREKSTHRSDGCSLDRVAGVGPAEPFRPVRRRLTSPNLKGPRP